MTQKYDLTIDVQKDKVHAHAYTAKGSQFLQETAENGWNPGEVMANLPPSIRLGVRTSARKKFVLVPPHSLH